MPQEIPVWRLQSKLERRFKSGHPWAYSNELQQSPKGLAPGAEVVLQDAAGRFVARGYGNPHSLIAFRAISRAADEADALSAAGLRRRLEGARSLRSRLGLTDVSHRWCFGEGDGLPGLIVDRYVLDGVKNALLVVQAHTAGMDHRLLDITQALAEIDPDAWILARNDVGVRKLEGVTVEEEPRWLKGMLSAEQLRQAYVRVANAPGILQADLWSGQKTGLFLDQSANVTLLQGLVARSVGAGRETKILDLCSYVGQWSSALAAAVKTAGGRAHVVAVDASATALERAAANLRTAGAASIETLKADVLHELGSLPTNAFDVVICDPPALIKGRKDAPQGAHAYLQLNTQALACLKPRGGWFATFSCSGLMSQEDFARTLAKAVLRQAGHPAGVKTLRWVAQVGQGPDHPIRPDFPEGRYLKGWIGAT